MRDRAWRPYVPLAERRRRALKRLAKMKNKPSVVPVMIKGRAIARSFWGKSWCSNLERYSDYANRLPRGRTYVRNGSIVDLQIATSAIAALVSGSNLYTVEITIAPVAAARWTAICRDCAGNIDSLVELLQGRLSKFVMDRVCREGDGLFPAPKEITMSCSCPDWADMCKHVAAVLYGVGARLDENPALLFALRGVDANELIATAATPSLKATQTATTKVLSDGDVAALFGLEIIDAERSGNPSPRKPSRQRTRPDPNAPARGMPKRTDKQGRANPRAIKAEGGKGPPDKQSTNGLQPKSRRARHPL
jgi:uncharacterized Zn finger protein